MNAVLNGYLSKLRRVLADGDGDAVLATQAPGYVLRVPAERLDARRFEGLFQEGREALARGDADQAAASLRAALALWRGPALADLVDQQFAQSEIRRLDELRLAALEDRIDADLALGRHDALVAELETLVAENPYRERLQGQLLLALYRSGRQAEALEAYQRARRTLLGELGIAPGPRLQELERAILRQDTSLEAPTPIAAAIPPGRQPEVPARKRRSRARVALALAAALAAVVATSMLVVRNRSTTSPIPLSLVGNSVAVVDPATSSIAAEIPVGGRPSGVAVGYGSVWVVNSDDETLLRIDPRSRKVVRTIGLGAKPTDLAVGAGGVWILSDWTVRRVDPDINDVVATHRLPRRPLFPWILIEADANSVWVCSCATLGGALSHIDPETNVVALLREGPVGVIAFGEGALWALTGYQLETIERIDPRTKAVVETIPRTRVGEITGGHSRHIAAGEGAVWVASGQTLWKLNPATDRFVGSVSLRHTAHGVAIGDGAIWVAASDGSLLRIETESERVVETIPLGVYATDVGHAIGLGEGAVWVATVR